VLNAGDIVAREFQHTALEAELAGVTSHVKTWRAWKVSTSEVSPQENEAPERHREPAAERRQKIAQRVSAG
jgi:hypothetical protein